MNILTREWSERSHKSGARSITPLASRPMRTLICLRSGFKRDLLSSLLYGGHTDKPLFWCDR